MEAGRAVSSIAPKGLYQQAPLRLGRSSLSSPDLVFPMTMATHPLSSGGLIKQPYQGRKCIPLAPPFQFDYFIPKGSQ